MTASTMDSFDSMLKARYISTDLVEKLVFTENYFLEMTKKRGNNDIVGGKYIVVPVQYALPTGTGARFSTAQGRATNTRTADVQVEMGDFFADVKIGEKVMAASKTPSQAFFKNETLEIDGLYTRAGELLSLYAIGNGGGALARVATGGVTGNVITLQAAGQASNFEVGDYIVGSNDGDGSAGTETLLAGVAQITATNWGGNTITVDDIANLPGITGGTYLGKESEFFGAGGVIIMRGLQAWITASDSPQALWNVTAATRAINPLRFAGGRIPTSEIAALGLDERFSKAGAYGSAVFKTRVPTTAWVNPLDWQVLETQLRAKGYSMENDEESKFGKKTIKAVIGGNVVPIRSERHIPRGQVYLLRNEDFGLHWLGGDLLYPQDEGAGRWLRMYNSTDIEFRLISHPAFVCYTPRNQVRFASPGFDV